MQIHVAYTQQNKTLIIGKYNVCMGVTTAYVPCKAICCILRAMPVPGKHSLLHTYFFMLYTYDHIQ